MRKVLTTVDPAKWCGHLLDFFRTPTFAFPEDGGQSFAVSRVHIEHRGVEVDKRQMVRSDEATSNLAPSN